MTGSTNVVKSFQMKYHAFGKAVYLFSLLKIGCLITFPAFQPAVFHYFRLNIGPKELLHVSWCLVLLHRKDKNGKRSEGIGQILAILADIFDDLLPFK